MDLENFYVTPCFSHHYHLMLVEYIKPQNTESVCTTREKKTDRNTFFFQKTFFPPKKIKKYPVMRWSEKIPVAPFYHWIPETRNLRQLHHFTIGFQKPGICADSWFLESNGKMVQLGFSLIKNRDPRVQFPCLQIDTVQPENNHPTWSIQNL